MNQLHGSISSPSISSRVLGFIVFPSEAKEALAQKAEGERLPSRQNCCGSLWYGNSEEQRCCRGSSVYLTLTLTANTKPARLS